VPGPVEPTIPGLPPRSSGTSCSQDYRQTLVVGPGGCPGPPGAGGDEPSTAGAASRSIRRRHRWTPLSEQEAVFIPEHRIKVKKKVAGGSYSVLREAVALPTPYWAVGLGSAAEFCCVKGVDVWHDS
jgi:hypothetical protein